MVLITNHDAGRVQAVSRKTATHAERMCNNGSASADVLDGLLMKRTFNYDRLDLYDFAVQSMKLYNLYTCLSSL